MSERLRVPCEHLWWEPHTIIGSGGQHCKGGQPPTVDEVVEWLRERSPQAEPECTCESDGFCWACRGEGTVAVTPVDVRGEAARQ
jgi:hypothetical protein